MSTTVDRYWEAITKYQKEYNYSPVEKEIPNIPGKVFISPRKRTKLVCLITSSLVEYSTLDILRKVGTLEVFNSITELEIFYKELIPDSDKYYYISVATKDYDIPLSIIDQSVQLRLSSFQPLFEAAGEKSQTNNDAADNLLCKILSEGADTTQMKRSVLQAMILLCINEQEEIEESELLEMVKSKLNVKEKGLKNQIDYLKGKGRIESTGDSPILYKLSQREAISLRAIIEESKEEEIRFKSSFREVLSKYDILAHEEELLVNLKRLINKSLASALNNYENAINAAFAQLSQSLSDMIGKESAEKCIEDFKGVCKENPFLNRICASESFCQLYNSNKIEKYINGKTKTIYLDTPVVVYYLCSLNEYHARGIIWANKYFNSVLSLLSLGGNKIEFKVYEEYLKEIAGEIQKALRIAWFKDNYSGLGQLETSNTFYNYYLFLKGQLSDPSLSFNSFLSKIGIKEKNPELPSFNEITVKRLKSIFENTLIQVESKASFSGEIVEDVKAEYEEMLHSDRKNKTMGAMYNDVRQALFLLTTPELDYSRCDYYLASWDYSIMDLRDTILKTMGKPSSLFMVYNPGALTNRIAFSTFNAEKIDYSLWAYADKTDQISEHYKALFDDVLVPLFSGSGAKLSPLPGKILDIYDSFKKSTTPEDTEVRTEKGVPIEQIITEVRDRLVQQKISEREFKSFLQEPAMCDFLESFFQHTLDLMMKKEEYSKEIDVFMRNLKDYLEKLNAAQRSRVPLS